MKQKQIFGDKKTTLFQGRFRNHNDITATSFYLCVGVYGSFCMPCPPGTVFRHFAHDNTNGACVFENQTKSLIW